MVRGFHFCAGITALCFANIFRTVGLVIRLFVRATQSLRRIW
jgi:hypothetical protein